MFYTVLLTLPLLSSYFTFAGTAPPLSKQGDVAPSPHYDSRIVHGEKVEDIKDFPYVVSYTWTSKEGYKGFCSGAILTDDYVVTVAHCVDEIDDPSMILLRAGTTNRKDGGSIIEVLDIKIHPNYHEAYVDKPNMNFDVAMLETEPIRFADTVQPINMPDEVPYPAQFVNVTGWGDEHRGGTKPVHLRNVELETLDWNLCKNTFVEDLKEEMFCAAGYMKGVCTGDDGAPAATRGFQDYLELEGLVLYQKDCASGVQPAVFIKLSATAIRDFLVHCIKYA